VVPVEHDATQRPGPAARVVAETSEGHVTVTVLGGQRQPETQRIVGQQAADFDEVYAAHYADLTVQLYAYFGDRQEAQDVVQEAFCRALARWPAVSRFDDPVAWVRRVAWNLAVSKWRRARTAVTFLRRQRVAEPRTEGPEPDRIALITALATLPENQRRAVVLRYLADMTIQEIAERERVPEGTVKSWLHRGRAALALQLRPETDHESPEVRRA
jgi:RNA polymerase sigma-70 factor (ECF subfamily)